MGHAAIWTLVATIGLIHAWPITKEEAQHLIRWDYWPPLSTTPYFSGVYLASRPGSIHLKPQRFTVFNVFNNDADKHSHRNTLLYGSIMYKPTEMTTSVTNVAVQHAFEFAVDTIQQQSARQHISPKAILQEVVLLPLYVTGDNGESEMVIVQEFKTDLHQSMKFKSHVTLGTNFYLTIDDPMFQLRHRAAISLDRDGVYNLFQHTFAPFTTSESSVTQSTETCTSDACNSPSHPRILSFNVWNTNPSADVYGPSRRWHAYEKRLNHLVDVVLEANADIIGFQEVRYDSSLGKRGEHAQIQHLSQRLPQYQFVYQTAMSYINDRNPYERIEEGPAIFSRFPIIHTDYLLLSRNPNDPNDSHQRLCLHAVVDYPGWGFVDVYVTHLSLSEQSRELTMVEIWNFMKQGRGVTQVLLGDLNAEPQSRGIQFLQGKLEMVGQRTDLKDVFLEQHTEPTPRSLDTVDRDTKFTFPSDNPSKRIDFILYRGQGIVNSCKVLGQQPTSDTKTFPTDVGMLNANSPVYASDHRAVLTELSME